MFKDNKKNEMLASFLEEPESVQLSLLQNYVELVKLHAEAAMEKAAEEKAGEKYSRTKENQRYYHWGNNPGSFRVGEEKVRVQVPRIKDKETQKTEEVDIYKKMKQEIPVPEELLLKKLILGLSQKNYKVATQHLKESLGLSQSTVSRNFKEISRKVLEEFERRDLSKYDITAMLLDGKYLKKEQIIIALGITSNGMKVPLGFIQSTTENAEAIKGLLKDLISRNLNYEQGLLVVTDGSKGMIKAVRDTFGKLVVMQRCQWHKRENVVSYLNDELQIHYRAKLQRAYCHKSYEEAKVALWQIIEELEPINRSAANSLKEGLEETLTIHRLGLAEELGKTFCTTNSIENLNNLLESYLRKIKRWKNSDMVCRWISTALVEAEGRMHKITNAKKLFLLRIALKTELKLDQRQVI